MIITLTPNPSLDRTLRVPVLRPGEVHLTTGQTLEAGGKGVNVARALRGRGLDATALVPLGGPDGETFRTLAAEAGVDLRVAVEVASVRTNLTVITDGGETTKLNQPGPEVTAEQVETLLAAAVAAAPAGGWLAACGSLPPGAPDDVYARLCRAARATGVHVAVDTSGAALAAMADEPCDLLKPNAEELASVVGGPIETVGDAEDGARTLLAGRPGQVLVSLGADGAVLVDDVGAVWAEAVAGEVRNTVGAGDAMLAGFLAGGGRGSDALRLATTWAGAAVQSPTTAVDFNRQAPPETVNIVSLQEQPAARSRPLGERP
ncbi:MAG: 1-phosphofructokinase family hexose kinase [Actinomycetota bacterium]